jgi:hypothetical protein
MTKRRRDGVYIRWQDAQQAQECDDAPAMGLVTLHVCGWLVAEDAERVVVALEAGPWDHPGGWRHVVAIPCVNIMARHDFVLRQL